MKKLNLAATITVEWGYDSIPLPLRRAIGRPSKPDAPIRNAAQATTTKESFFGIIGASRAVSMGN